MKALLLASLMSSPFAPPALPVAPEPAVDPALAAYAQCFGEALDEQLGAAFAVDTCVELEEPLFKRYGAGDDRVAFRIRLARLMQQAFEEPLR